MHFTTTQGMVAHFVTELPDSMARVRSVDDKVVFVSDANPRHPKFSLEVEVY